MPRIVSCLKLAALVYGFLLGITLLGSAAQMPGAAALTRDILAAAANPFLGFFAGLLATSIAQSSSVTTSALVAMAAAGALDPRHAVPIVMGANVGTAVTNGIVSLGLIARTVEFKRAFAAAIIDDIFSLLTVGVLLPLELATGSLLRSSEFLAARFAQSGGLQFVDPLRLILHPVARTAADAARAAAGDGWQAPTLLACAALALVVVSLLHLVRELRVLLSTRLELWIHRVFARKKIRAVALGLAVTLVLHSSSATLSLMLPLAGVGVLSLEQVLFISMGAKVGTPATALFAAVALGSPQGLVVALAHFLFNLLGLGLFLLAPPLRRRALRLAERIAGASEKNKLVPFLWIGVVYFAAPLSFILFFQFG